MDHFASGDSSRGDHTGTNHGDGAVSVPRLAWWREVGHADHPLTGRSSAGLKSSPLYAYEVFCDSERAGPDRNCALHAGRAGYQH